MTALFDEQGFRRPWKVTFKGRDGLDDSEGHKGSAGRKARGTLQGP